MKKSDSKALEFIYQETHIHFLLGNEKNVMVNATEMAKAFGKRTDHFLQNETTKVFIERLKVPEMSGTLDGIVNENIIENRGRNGIYFHRILAMKFAAWLDIDFELWIYSKIEEILFGHYKTHWDAHIKQEDAKSRMEIAKSNLLLNANQKDVIDYFKAEAECKNAQSEKSKAIRNQLSIFD
jgi:hypothetical protein